jgi:Protein of unknown function (DUF1579)
VKFRSALILCPVFLAASAMAQMGGPPGPEVKKLDYFIGTWNTEGTIAQGPWGMGGKFSSTETSQWMAGNFFVESHSDFKMPSEVGGEGKAVGFMGYDAEANTYTFDQFNSQGRRENSKGTVRGDTWTWTSSANYGGQDIEQKMTIKTVSPTSYTLKFEISMDGKNWIPFMDGKATKK